MTHAIDDVTCLGCGCACDDIRVIVRDDRIIDAEHACPLGRVWFADGSVPMNVRVEQTIVPSEALVIPSEPPVIPSEALVIPSEALVIPSEARDPAGVTRGYPRVSQPGSLAALGMTDVSLDVAIDAAANLLSTSSRPLIYLAPNVSCEAQREAAAMADLLHARLDSATSATALPLMIAAQERGFASATFGEIRNRADVIVFWAIDIAGRYPRFESRYAPEPAGVHVPGGRGDRTVIGVDVGAAVSTVTRVDHRIVIDPADELAVLATLQGIVRETDSNSLPLVVRDESGPWGIAKTIADLMLAGRYTALVFDAEPDDRESRSPQRFDTLLGLSHALNEQTRCAAVALRAGGNRSGADSVLTAQTGYPLGVDFARGYPRYDAADGSRGQHDVVLVVGDTTALPRSTYETLERAQTILVGPHSSASPLGSVVVRIDTGSAGIHETGTAFRADEVPLRLRAPLTAGVSAAGVVRSLARRISTAYRKLSRPESATGR